MSTTELPATASDLRPEDLRTLAVVVEVVIVLLVVILHFEHHVWAWWHDGERITGVVVEVGELGDDGKTDVTIRDPETELTRSIAVGGDPQLGDVETIVVSPTNEEDVSEVFSLRVYLIWWCGLVAAAVLWPIACVVAHWWARPRWSAA